MRKPRHRYSLHVIQPTGEPRPVAVMRDRTMAVGGADIAARETGLEVRVWDTLKGRCIYTAPAVSQ